MYLLGDIGNTDIKICLFNKNEFEKGCCPKSIYFISFCELQILQYLSSLFTIKNIITNKQVKIAKFGTFILRKKKQRIGRNPKTKEEKIISERFVILFKPSKELKKYVNNNE